MADFNIQEVLWKEWKYRHEVYWRSLFRWGAAIVTISIIPYVKTSTFEFLGDNVLIFPILAFLLSITGGWHLAAEYARMKDVRNRFDQSTSQSARTVNGILGWSVGTVATMVFIIGFTLLSVINGLILHDIAGRHSSQRYSINALDNKTIGQLSVSDKRSGLIHGNYNSPEIMPVEMQAKYIRSYYDALIRSGFKRKEALSLITTLGCMCAHNSHF